MKIVVGKLSGFCSGVNYTITKAEETITSSDETIYCLGEIVHNERVIKDLESKGMITINDIEEAPNNSKVIFRAHGEKKEIIERAKEKNIDVIDLTCGKIRVIRNKIAKNIEDSIIIIIGKKNHPETLGNLSFSGTESIIVESKEDIKNIKENIKEFKNKKVYIVSQTTFLSSLFDEFIDLLKEELKDYEIIVDKTICDATENRQKETKELASQADKMIIIGGKNSSNTKELASVAEKYCENVYLVQDIEDLKDITLSEDDFIGIMAGASTPQVSINEIKDYIESKKV